MVRRVVLCVLAVLLLIVTGFGLANLPVLRYMFSPDKIVINERSVTMAILKQMEREYKITNLIIEEGEGGGK